MTFNWVSKMKYCIEQQNINHLYEKGRQRPEIFRPSRILCKYRMNFLSDLGKQVKVSNHRSILTMCLLKIKTIFFNCRALCILYRSVLIFCITALSKVSLIMNKFLIYNILLQQTVKYSHRLSRIQRQVNKNKLLFIYVYHFMYFNF